MSYRKLTAQEKDAIVKTFLTTKSAVVTGETWDIDPAEVIAIHFFHGRPEPDPEPPTSAKKQRLLSLTLVRRTA